MSIETRISEFKEEFEPQLKSFFEQQIEKFETSEERHIWEKLRDYTLAGGKRIRPFLLWKMLEKTRAKIKGLPDVLVAFELLHSSTLIEDDIIDQHTTRRHKPTLPSSLNNENLNGEHISLIAAGLTRCASLDLIINADISNQFKQECVDAYNQISTAVNEGQTLDLSWTGKLDISETDLINQAEKVAARFIEYMFKLGADKAEVKELWAEIGLHLGLVFQLADDLMDIDKNKRKGRPLGDDIRLGKTTPLIITAYNNLPTEDKEQFMQNFGNVNISEDELEWMIQACEKTGAISHIRDLIKERLAKVDTALSLIKNNDKNHWIHELKKFSIERVS